MATVGRRASASTSRYATDGGLTPTPGPTTFEATRHHGVLSGPVRGDDIAFTVFGPTGRQVAWPVVKVGKSRAGRLLDGREWNEVPCATT